MEQETIQVIIFEDNPDIREALYYLLNGTPGFACKGAFPDCSKLVKNITDTQPDLILMDINMPGMTGIEAVCIVKKEFPEIPVVMQTVFEDDEKIFAAICAGASGYLLKSTPPARLLEALREIRQGGWPMSPSVAAKVLQMFKSQNPSVEVKDFDLSPREKEILSLLVDGLSYKMIAGQLHISYETVHSHLKKIYQKLHVNSMNEAVSKALRNRLV